MCVEFSLFAICASTKAVSHIYTHTEEASFANENFLPTLIQSKSYTASIVALYYILNRLHNKTSCSHFSHLPLSLFTSAGWYNDEHKEEEEEEKKKNKTMMGCRRCPKYFC